MELRNANIMLYFLLEVAKAVIYSILLYIVTKYSTAKKNQEEKQNEFMNDSADAFIRDLNNRTESWLQSNPLFSPTVTTGEKNDEFRSVMDKLLAELQENEDD